MWARRKGGQGLWAALTFGANRSAPRRNGRPGVLIAVSVQQVGPPLAAFPAPELGGRAPVRGLFVLMVHIPVLQPFEDVNTRASRLRASIPLIRHNLSPLPFMTLPEEPCFRRHSDGLRAQPGPSCWPISASSPTSAPAIATPPHPPFLPARTHIRAMAREIVLEAHADIGACVADDTPPEDTRTAPQDRQRRAREPARWKGAAVRGLA